jgi:site-specific DNA-methyltransferase (adenine-specific)
MTNATTPHHDTLVQLETMVSKLAAQVNTLSGEYHRLIERLSGHAPPRPSVQESRLLHGDCIEIMRTVPDGSVDLIVTDPPYLVRYKSRDGRTIQNDDHDGWLNPAFAQMHRVLKEHSFCISFYPWNKVDRFMHAWKRAGFQPVGHFVFSKNYASSQGFTKAHHECAYLLAKGNPEKPAHAPRDVLG